MAMRKNRPVIIFFMLLILVILLAGTSFYFYKKANKTPGAGDVQAETKSLVKEVGQIAILPENETPTLATVSDPAKLSNQLFFADAKKGDKVLIYTNAKKAVLYDPEAKKIVNMAPIDLGATGSNAVTIPPEGQ